MPSSDLAKPCTTANEQIPVPEKRIDPVTTVDDDNKIGYLPATSYVIGNVIGSGIFVTPTSILQQTNSAGLSLIVWTVCGGISMLGALCYVELGTSIPYSGADFAYVCYVKWYPVAFVFMWVSALMTFPASSAIGAETFGAYIIEGLKPVLCIRDDYQRFAAKSLGFSLLWLLTWMNFFSLNKVVGKFQVVVTGAKLFATVFLIAVGLYLLIFKGKTENLEHMMEGSDYNSGSLVLAIYSGLFSYAGAGVLNYGSEEIRNPKRTLPFAMISGLTMVTVIYLCINLSYFVVLTVDTMKESDAVAATLLSVSISFIGDLNQLISYVTFILYLQAAFTLAALLWIRLRKVPVSPNAVTMPIIIPVVFFILTCVLVAIPFVQQFKLTVIGLGFLLSGAVVYIILVRPAQLPSLLTRADDESARWAAIIFNGLPSSRKKL